MPLLLLASAFFSGSETALFSLSSHQRLRLSRDKHLASQAAATLLAETRSLLLTLLMGNMVINVLFFAVSTLVLFRLQTIHKAHAVVITFMTVAPLILIIIAGEVFPKLMATRMAMGWTKLFAIPLLIVHRIISPLRAVVNFAIITPLARLIAPSSKPKELSSDELEALLQLSQQHGVIDDDEEQTLQQVLALGQRKVRDLMTPRVELEAFDLDRDPAELIEMFKQTRLSRLPVCRGDLDHVEGVVYFRQVLLSLPKTKEELKPLVRTATFVPELQRADRLLIDFRKRGVTLAIVVDEYGGTAGLITLEDLVEHMVGEIAGPYEPGLDTVESLGHESWRVSGHLSIGDWTGVFGKIDPGYHMPRVSTIGGLVTARLGRLPSPGDRIHVGNLELEVERTDSRRVETILIRLIQQQRPGADQIPPSIDASGEVRP